MERKVRQFFEETFCIEFGDRITEDCNLFQQGIINSRGYMELLNFLEKEFNVVLTDDELFSNVLVSFSGILDFLESKSASN